MATDSEPAKLTRRQREVLKLIARGLTNGEIAERLGISLAGVKWHVSEILSRMGVATREEAVAMWAAEHHPVARLRRALLSPVAGLFTTKLALGATAAAAVAIGGWTAYTALTDEGEPSAGAAVSPDAAPPVLGPALGTGDRLVVGSLEHDGMRWDLRTAKTADVGDWFSGGPCYSLWERPVALPAPTGADAFCGSFIIEPAPERLLGSTLVVAGVVRDDVDHVEFEWADRSRQAVPVQVARLADGREVRFYLAALPATAHPSWLIGKNAYGADFAFAPRRGEPTLAPGSPRGTSAELDRASIEMLFALFRAVR